MARDSRQTVMLVSVLASGLMVAGKLTAYFLTNSTALLADGAESVVHCVATGFAAFSLWYAARPADSSHPYGHGRIAYLSIGFEGALVVAASLAVAYSGIMSLIHGPQLRDLGVGFTIAVGLATVNLVLALFLIHIGKKQRSMIVVANGKHVLTDVLTTGAAIVGVGAVMLTGIEWLDPVAAILIAVCILATGMSLVRTSVAGLMDKLDPQLSEQLIGCLETAITEGRIAGFHQLHCRSLDDRIWIDVHILLPGKLSLLDAHARATRLEASMQALLAPQSASIVSHIEPADHQRTHPAGHEAAGDPLRHGASDD